jgi:hypothetical protein
LLILPELSAKPAKQQRRRPRLRVGEPQPIVGLLNVAANSVTAHPGQVVAATGTGYYDFPSVPGTQDFPVQGGAVTVGSGFHHARGAERFPRPHLMNADWSRVSLPQRPSAPTSATVTDFTATGFDLATLSVVALPLVPAPTVHPPGPGDRLRRNLSAVAVAVALRSSAPAAGTSAAGP